MTVGIVREDNSFYPLPNADKNFPINRDFVTIGVKIDDRIVYKYTFPTRYYSFPLDKEFQQPKTFKDFYINTEVIIYEIPPLDTVEENLRVILKEIRKHI